MEWLPFEQILVLNVYKNDVRQWLVAVAIVMVTVLVLNLSRRIIGNRIAKLAERTTTDLDDFVADLIKSTQGFLIWSIALALGSVVLTLNKGTEHILHLLPILAFLLQLSIWGSKFIDFLLHRYVNSRGTEDEQLATQTMMAPVKFVALILLWGLLIVVALDNIGMDITALVAGLGVGGIAVALAVQNVLSDLFAAMSIVIDKPFVIGDFIIVGDMMGNVEHIGLKTTRVRSLGGEQLIFSNSDLLTSRIRNYKRMFERRIVFKFGVVYQTKLEQLRAIPGMVREMIEAQELTRFDRAHFASYGDSSLDFEIVYYVLAPDFPTYMDIQQQINLEMFKRFAELGIEFAYPTRTLYMVNEGAEDEPVREPKPVAAK